MTIEAGSGRPVIFLHGWTMRGAVFAGQIARLAGRARCLAPDLPGHGAAPGPARLDAMARAVAALIAERGLERPVLVGWSMGAAVAWRYARLFGCAGLAGIVSVDMSPRLINQDGWTLGMIGQTTRSAAAFARRLASDWEGAAGAIAAGMFARPPGPRGFDVDAARAQIAACDPARMLEAWRDLAAMDERATIGALALPFAVFHGARSRVYPAETARWLVRAAPQAERVAFARSGHSPHLEEPDAFAAALGAFLDRLD
ncbi:alpha/beta fold hydrolase [Oceanicella actignis]|uniref:alpha/beta fold hydrolase n=1 Tax=Oceanicella actignis TaxID=1189325 RepID=UPI0011E62FA4|nr:alpha/beta hydrolase [Oceanicella actignis]TYO91300.1 pimeloyl-[acyl-carrier protein] methyl ester esterase [Oceanicella actignis]